MQNTEVRASVLLLMMYAHLLQIVNLLRAMGYQIFNRHGSSVQAIDYDEYLCLPPNL